MKIRIEDLVDEFFKKYDSYEKVKEHWGIRTEYTIFDLVDNYFENSSNDLNSILIKGGGLPYFHCGEDLVLQMIPNHCWIIYPTEEGAWWNRKLADKYKSKYLFRNLILKYVDSDINIISGRNSDFIVRCETDKEFPLILKFSRLIKVARQIPDVSYVLTSFGNILQLVLKNKNITKK